MHERREYTNNKYAMDAVADISAPPEGSAAPKITFGFAEGNDVGNGLAVYTSASTKPPHVNIEFPAAPKNEETRYTLVLVDPDGENLFSRDTAYAHWIITDLGPDDVPFSKDSGALDALDVIVPYQKPDHDTDVHRFVFILYEETTTRSVDRPGQRDGFNLRDWADENELVAVAGAYFVSVAEGEKLTPADRDRQQQAWVDASRKDKGWIWG